MVVIEERGSYIWTLSFSAKALQCEKYYTKYAYISQLVWQKNLQTIQLHYIGALLILSYTVSAYKLAVHGIGELMHVLSSALQ